MGFRLMRKINPEINKIDRPWCKLTMQIEGKSVDQGKSQQARQEFGYSIYRKSQYHDRVITYG